jgi:hypothetical protein
MNTVWVVRADGRGVIGASVRSPAAAVADVMAHCGAATKASMGRLLRVIELSDAFLNSYAHDGFTLSLETLLSPAHAAVIAAAKAMVGVVYPPKSENYREYMTALGNLVAAVAALRALEGGA